MHLYYLDKYQKEWKAIIPRDNATPHVLLLRLFDRYDERTWNAIKAQTPFHKLSYKMDDKLFGDELTYFKKLFQ